jgi:hypothetical protein
MGYAPFNTTVEANLTTLLSRVTAAVALSSDMSTVLSRLSSARAGYLDNIASGVLAAGGFLGAESGNRATILQADTEETNSGNGYMQIKVFTLKCRNGSTVYCTWDARHAGADVNPLTGIMVNDVVSYSVALGGGGGYVAQSTTITGLNDGDRLGFFVKRDNGGGTVGLRTARVLAVVSPGRLTTGSI